MTGGGRHDRLSPNEVWPWRDRALEAVNESHYLTQILDRVPDGLLVFDRAGICTISNPAGVQLLGNDATLVGVPGPGAEVHSVVQRSLRSGEVASNQPLVVRNPSTRRQIALLASSAPL